MKTLLTSAAVLMAAGGIAMAADVDFVGWDTNGDGFVDAQEYASGMKAENVEIIAMDLDQIQAWIRENNPEVVFTGKDTNGDGSLDTSEVQVQDGSATVQAESGTGVAKDKPSPAFVAFDADEDGMLSADEFAKWQAFAVDIGVFGDK